jgi:uncharacterized protein (TIGR00290 family)
VKKKVLHAWSGGKDSALALHELRRGQTCEVAALLTTVTTGYDRISMHGVRRRLLERQAQVMELPLEIVPLGQHAALEEYEQQMKETLLRCRQQGIESVAFGDILLDEVRRYRQENLAKAGMTAIFPLWGTDTTELANGFIRSGFKAVVACVDLTLLAGAFVGRDFDATFLADLPAGVDPCGERGEFHSFVYDGPIFTEPIGLKRGQTVVRENRFCYVDLTLAQDKAAAPTKTVSMEAAKNDGRQAQDAV